MKRIAQLLIPDASASFHAHIYISFVLFLFLSRSTRPAYFQHLSERIDMKTLTETLLSNSLRGTPKPVYVSIIYRPRCLWACEFVQPLSALSGWLSMQVHGQTLPHTHTETYSYTCEDSY